MSRAVVAGVLACVLSTGFGVSAFAEDTTNSEFTINVPKSTGAEDVYNFNLANDLGVSVENSVVSHDGVAIYNTNRNIQTIIEENASRYSNVYEGDGQRGLYDSTNNVWKRDGNYLLFLAHHGGLNNVLGQNDFSTLEDGVDINDVINFLYDNRYAAPQQASNMLRQRFGNDNMFSKMIDTLYSEVRPGSGFNGTEPIIDAVRGGTSGFYTDLKELVDTLTYDEHKSDLSLAVNNLDVNNAGRNTIVGTGNVTGTNSIAIGNGHQVTGNNSGAFGDPNIVNGDNSYIVGNNSIIHANVKDAFVLGNNTTVSNGLPENWNSMTDADKQAWANGLSSTDIKEGVIALGNNISVSLDNKATDSRSSTSEGDPEIEHVVAVGDNAVIGEENAIAIGFQSKATALNSLAVGQGAEATGEGTTAISETAKATGHFANAFGYKAQALKEGGSAFGQNAVASEKFGTAFGRFTKADGESAIAVGNNAHAVSQSSVAIGLSSIANGGVNTSSVAIGNGARTGKVDGDGNPTNGYGETVAIGGQSYVENAYASAIGSSANATGQGGTALGSHASVTAQNAVALGYNAVANEANTVSVGTSSDKRRVTNVADGTSATNAATVGQTVELVAGDNVTIVADDTPVNGIGQKRYKISATATGGSDLHYIGVDGDDDSDNNYNGGGASGYRSIAVGHDASASYQDAIAIGSNTDSDGDGSIAMGVMSQASGNNSLALMAQSRAVPDGAMAIGYLATAEGGDSVVIGTKASTTERSSSSVAIGNTASTEGQASIAIGGLAKAEVNNSVVIGLNAKSEAINPEGTFGAVVIGVNGITNNGVAIGSDVDATGNTSVAIGPKAKSLGNNSVALGEQSSTAEYQGIAIGYKAQSTSNSAVAIGGGSEASGSFASIAVGPNAKAQGGGVAIGTASRTYEYGSVAVGPNARVVRGIDNSVAIGMDSWAEEEGVVSFGTAAKNDDPEKTRRLLHVTAGIDDTDAVNVSQLREAVAGAGGGATYTAGNGIEISNDNAISAKAGTNVTIDNNGINVVGNGVINEGNAGLISGGTLYNEVNVASDGNYIIVGDTTAQNLGKLDTAIKNVDNSSIKSMTANGTTVTYTKGDGTTGTFTTQDTNTEYTAGNGLELTGTEFKAKAGTNVTVDGNGISVAGNGTVASGNTGLVSGGTVFGETRVASDGNYIEATNTASQNLVALDNALKDNADALDGKANVSLDNITDAGKTVIQNATNVVSGDSVITVTPTTENGVKTYTITASVNPDGAIAEGNTGLVSGGAVYNEVRPTNGNYIEKAKTTAENLTALDDAIKNATDGLDGKANVALDNITDAGHSVIKTDAKASVNVTGGSYATVDKTDVNGVDTYTVNVATDGAVADGDTKLVTGDTVYDALQTQKTEIDTALDNKANKDASNVSSYASEWGTAIGTGTVDASDGKLVTGATVAGETRVASNGNYIQASNTAGQNLVALDNALKNNADALDGKANITLDNVTDAGHTVIKTDAKSAINVVGGTYATVDKTDVNGVDTYTVNVATDGAVVSGNTKLVTGGTVYDAIQDIVAGDMTGKANINLDNVNDAGHTVIKTDAKSVINVAGNGDISVNKTDVNGVDTYNLSVVKDGAVASGEEKLVTGGTVYDALQAEARPAQNGNYITTNNTAGANLTALDNAIKSNEDAISGLDDSKANVTLDNITNEGQIVIKNLAKEAVKVVAGTNTTVTEGTDGDAKTYAVNVATNGAVASGNTGIVTGDTVYNETRIANDGQYVEAGNTVAENIQALDNALKGMSDGAVTYDNTTKKFSNGGIEVTDITMTGKVTAGTGKIGGLTIDNNKVSGLANGEVSVTSTEAINGSQLFTTNTNLAQEVTNRETADTALSERIGTLASDGNYITVANNVSQNLSALDTAIKSNEDAIGQINTDLTGKANVALDNITDAGKTVIKTNAKEAINVVGGTYATVDKTDVSGVDTYTVNVATDGQVVSGNTKLVTGGTVYDAIQDIVTGDIAGKANISLDNVNEAGHTVIKTDAKFAINVAGNEDIAVSKTDVNGVDTYNVAIVKDGAIASGEEKVVTGGAVYDALVAETRPAQDGNYIVKDGTAGENLIALDEAVKANEDAIATNAGNITNLKNLSNITEAGETVIKNLAKGSVNVVGTDKATVTKSDVNGVDTYTVSVKADGQVAQGDTNIVSGDTVYQALQTERTTTNTALDDKANIELDNITDEGHDVIKTDAKSAINVTGDTDALVTKTDVNGVDTYAISINKNGAVAQGNEEIVTGGTVYDALQGQRNEINTVLDTKANIDLDNITDNGKTVVRNLAKESVKVIPGSEHVRITEGTDGNAKTYAVGILANGAVATGNTALVTGNTVFNEVRVENDGNYVLKNNTAGQNITELDRVLKETRDIAEAAAIAGEDANAVHYDGADKETITLAGAEGTLLTNLKDGDISATSTDAVTGKQLFETNERIGQVETRVDTLETTVGTMTDGNYIGADKSVGENLSVLDSELKNVSDGLNTVTNDIGELRDNLDGKLNTNMDNLTSDGESVISTIAKNAVKVEGTGLATVTSAEKDNAMVYTVDVQANGKVEEGNANLVDGGTVYDAVQGAKDYADGLNTETRDYVAEKLGNKADTDLGNITEAGKEKIRETMKDDLDKKANVDASNINPDVWAEKLGVGEVADGNTGLVNGDTVYKALQNVESDIVKADFDAGVIRVGGTPKYDEIGVMDISNSQGEGRVLTGVVTDPSDANSAANVGYVNAVGENIMGNVSAGFNRMDAKINKVGANAAAMASLSPIPNEDDVKWNVAAAVGNYKDATAGAVGVFYKPAENVMLNVRGSFGNDENMVGGGVTFALSKSEVPGVTKATLAKAVNTQAQHIKELESNNQQLQQDNEAMRQMMIEMQERLEKLEKNSK